MTTSFGRRTASVVASIRVAGKQEPWSTNFDLYRFDAAGKQAPVNLTASNPAWDAGPVFSADGKTLFYRAMKRPGFEADRFGLMAMDVASGKTREIAPQWDRSAGGITLSADGASITPLPMISANTRCSRSTWPAARPPS